tara:strand:- start:1540 stop:1818 length:279 start_codon:yes stop_codon:yes gene_type:complete
MYVAKFQKAAFRRRVGSHRNGRVFGLDNDDFEDPLAGLSHLNLARVVATMREQEEVALVKTMVARKWAPGGTVGIHLCNIHHVGTFKMWGCA